jgi:hypothetical protein
VGVSGPVNREDMLGAMHPGSPSRRCAGCMNTKWPRSPRIHLGRRGETERDGEACQPWHWVAIPNMGLSVGEMFYLEELAEGCAGNGSYEFFFIAPPLPTPAASVLLSTQ